MTCERVRSWMLLAELEALRVAMAPQANRAATNGAPARVARHLEHCAQCRADIHAILQGEQSLARALDSMAAGGAPYPEGLSERDVARSAATLRGGRWRRRRVLWAAAVVLAAAAIAGVMVFPMNRGSVRAVPTAPTAGLAALPVEPSLTQTPIVRLQPGQKAAVLEGEDPNITIVWYF